MNYKNKNSLKLKIIDTANNSKNKITIIWIPGHNNINNNEKEDKLAKETLKNERIYTK